MHPSRGTKGFQPTARPRRLRLPDAPFKLSFIHHIYCIWHEPGSSLSLSKSLYSQTETWRQYNLASVRFKAIFLYTDSTTKRMEQVHSSKPMSARHPIKIYRQDSWRYLLPYMTSKKWDMNKIPVFSKWHCWLDLSTWSRPEAADTKNLAPGIWSHESNDYFFSNVHLGRWGYKHRPALCTLAGHPWVREQCGLLRQTVANGKETYGRHRNSYSKETDKVEITRHQSNSCNQREGRKLDDICLYLIYLRQENSYIGT